MHDKLQIYIKKEQNFTKTLTNSKELNLNKQKVLIYVRNPKKAFPSKETVPHTRKRLYTKFQSFIIRILKYIKNIYIY